MHITYVGPHDEVEIDGVGTVKNGATIEVPDALAGRPPEPRVLAAHLELAEAIEALEHARAQELRTEIAGLDYGAGLLAQIERDASGEWTPNWVPKAKATRAAAAHTDTTDGEGAPA